MNIRCWATLAVRCFGLYQLIVSGTTVLWTLLNYSMSLVGMPPGQSRPLDGEPLGRAILYSVIWLAAAVLMLVFSDSIIRWIARVPRESPDKTA